MNSQPRRSGFTLIELLVTLAVLAILASIAAPNFARIIAQNQTTSAANEFLGMLQTARSEAVRLNRTVQVIAESDDWTLSVEIFSPDTNTVLRTRPALRPQLTLDGPETTIEFSPAGDSSGSEQAFELTHDSGPSRWICVDLSGSARIEPEGC